MESRLQFLGDVVPISVDLRIASKLKADTTTQGTKCGSQQEGAISPVNPEVSLGEQIAEVNRGLPLAAAQKARQRLPHGKVKIRLQLVGRLAKAIQSRHGRPIHPLVAGSESRVSLGQTSGNAHRKGMAAARTQDIAQLRLHRPVLKRQGTRPGLHGSHL